MSARRRSAAAVGVAALMTLLALLLLGGPAHAGAGAMSVPDSSEAYYTTVAAASCTAPVGCPPAAPASVFPADTLHVGFTAGSETFRSYLTPDLAALPAGAQPSDGTLTLPVATDQQAGTLDPAAARILACLATAPAPDGTAGATSPPPGLDPSVCAPATYRAAENAFTVDLTPFLAAWAAGRPVDGIALLPAPSSAATDVWHVAFNGRHRAGTPHASSVIDYSSAPVAPAGGGLAAAAPPAGPPPAGLPALPGGPVASAPLPAPAPQLAPAAAPQVQPAPAAAPVAFRVGFRQPMVFLMPLGLLAGAVFLGRLFTRDPLAGAS